jgi:[NiFe] hydrogenase assembly HybE family chaperone
MATDDPVAGLRAAFERIAATRMAGLPLCNPRLTVAAIGFVPWEDVQVGVLVTPWMINLVAVSTAPEVLRLAVDTRRAWRFPSGEYELMGGEEPECGAFQFCSLFSPTFEFADQAAAEATALEAMRGLFAVPPPPASAGVSRRNFLRGAFGTAKA